VKIILSVFVLKTENKSEKENDLTNKADVFAGC